MEQEAGQSLFQGGEQLNVNINDSQAEREALEEQLRRDQELGTLLTNAFDDLIDDDNQSSINLTTISGIQNPNDFQYDRETSNDEKYNEPHKEHCLEYQYRQTDCYSIDQLKVLYEARVRENIELKELNGELNDCIKMQTEKNRQIQETLENEKAQLVISLNEAHNQIANLKKDRETLIQANNELKDKLRNEESEKEEISIKLSSAHQLLLDLEEQMKNNIVGRNEAERNTQEHLAKLRESYKNDTTRLENLIRVKDETIAELTTKLQEQEKANLVTLMQKTETIDRLVRNVEESQKNCERFTSAMQELTTRSLSKTCQDTAGLELKEAVQKQLAGNESNFVYRCDDNLLTRLQDELKRAIILKNNKQTVINDLEKEIINLKTNIKTINEELECYKTEHDINSETIKNLKIEITDLLNKLNESNNTHINHIKVLQETIEKNKNDNLKFINEKDSHISQLENKIKHLDELFVSQQDNREKLTMKEQELINCKTENEILQRKVNELSKLKEKSEIKVQETEEKAILEKDLVKYNDVNIRILENRIEEKNSKIEMLESKINKYQVKFEELKNKFLETYNEALFNLDTEKKCKEQIYKENALLNNKILKLSKELQILSTAVKTKEELLKNLEIILGHSVPATVSQRKETTPDMKGKTVSYVLKSPNLSEKEKKEDSTSSNKNLECHLLDSVNEENKRCKKIVQEISDTIFKYTKENDSLITQNRRYQTALSEANKMEVIHLKRICILKKALMRFCKEIGLLHTQIIRFKSYIKVMNKNEKKPLKVHKKIQTVKRVDEIGSSKLTDCKKYRTHYETFLKDIHVHLQTLTNLTN